MEKSMRGRFPPAVQLARSKNAAARHIPGSRTAPRAARATADTRRRRQVT